MIDNFLNSLHQSHLDNAKRLYVAKTIGKHSPDCDVSPVTNFVFEFFLYNSLYAVDWESSYDQQQLVYHDRQSEITESKMQNAFEDFCRKRCQEPDVDFLNEAFLPLAGLYDLSGQLTNVETTDARNAEAVNRFFSKIAEIGQLAAKDNLRPTKRSFELISACRFFAYGIRNNIFHGSKDRRINNCLMFEVWPNSSILEVFG